MSSWLTGRLAMLATGHYWFCKFKTCLTFPSRLLTWRHYRWTNICLDSAVVSKLNIEKNNTQNDGYSLFISTEYNINTLWNIVTSLPKVPPAPAGLDTMTSAYKLGYEVYESVVLIIWLEILAQSEEFNDTQNLRFAISS